MGTTNEQNSITYIPLDSIKVSPDNPNVHSEAKIRTLALSIKEFGLLNPISVKSKPDGTFEIVAGEGRFESYLLLESEEPGHWSSIPAVGLADSSDYLDWGRRLAENQVRSFNWIGACKELANMKAEHLSTKALAALFGFSETHVRNMVAIGQMPGIERLSKVAAVTAATSGDQVCKITLLEAEKYLLPLRICVERRGNIPIWDFSEVKVAIDKLVSGELTREDLAAYSADRREAIGKAKAKAEKIDEQDPQKSQQATEQITKLNTKINNIAAHNETLKRSNDDLQADRESLKKTVAGLNNRLKELETTRAESSSEEIERLLEEKMQQEREALLKQAKMQAQQEFQENWSDLVKEKRAFEEYEQAIHTKARELKEWEKLIDHSKRSMDRDARQRMLDAIDGLVDAVTSLRRNWELLSQPVFEEWIEHLKTTRGTYQKLYAKCNTGNKGNTGNDDKTKEILE